MMKRSLISVLSLLMLVLCIPALAESTDWNYDANYAILRGYDGAGGDVVVPAEIDGFTVDVKHRWMSSRSSLTCSRAIRSRP